MMTNLESKRQSVLLEIIGKTKILNVYKAPLERIQKNAEIMTMIEAFGLSVDKSSMKLTYRPEDLRYGKIIIMSDADVDGAHIKNLFYTFIWSFCPQLIIDGYVYAGYPPLYQIIQKKDQYSYLRDEAALAKFKKEHSNEKYIVKHLKGYELVWPLSIFPFVSGVA